MVPLIVQHRRRLVESCRTHRVRRLEVFGSASNGERFDSKESDLGLLVEFLHVPAGEKADTYFGLLEALQALFGRPVDLVVTSAVKNPYFLEAVAADRELLYAA